MPVKTTSSYYYCFFSVVSELALELPEALGALGAGAALEDDEEAGALLEPPAALPLEGCDGAAVELELDEPPEAGALGVAALDELEELLSLLLVSTDAEPETLEPEPEGAVEAEPDGAVVEPADEDEPGVVR